MAKFIHVYDLTGIYAKTVGKYCLFISIYDVGDFLEKERIFEVVKAAPYLKDHLEFLFDSNFIVECESEVELEQYYNITVGDDGPTQFNDYNGPVRVYAAAYNPEGILMYDNT